MAGNRTCVRFSIKCVTHVTESRVECCVTEMWIPRLSWQRVAMCENKCNSNSILTMRGGTINCGNFEACLLVQYQVHLHTTQRVEWSTVSRFKGAN